MSQRRGPDLHAFMAFFAMCGGGLVLYALAELKDGALLSSVAWPLGAGAFLVWLAWALWRSA